ncbi:MAG: single-stranded DNA-binding protein [Egibacteraceae bacterium]
MNTVTVAGNLADDPDLRYTPNGAPVCTVRVAVNRRVKTGDGWDDRLDGFFTVQLWRDHAANAAESLRKGDRVIVTGRLTCRSYEAPDGTTRWVTEIQAEEICPSLRWAQAKPRRITRHHSQPVPAGAGPPAGGPADDDVPF